MAGSNDREYCQVGQQGLTLAVIGVIHSCFPEKFGIPRQSGLVPSALATIELLAPFNKPETVRGLETFSHIWVQFLFHQSLLEGWKATVRPPRMGGKERCGVFATRSPHRPNHIGLSAVRLLGLEVSDSGVTIEIGGIDMLDGTPVLDIKPYIPYSDCLPGATKGWLLDLRDEMEVVLSRQAELFCRVYEQENGRPLTALIREVLAADPRPASQKGQRSGFGMSFWDVNVRWRVSGTTCRVESCERLTAAPE